MSSVGVHCLSKLYRPFPSDIPDTNFPISMNTLRWVEVCKNQKANKATMLKLMFHHWYGCDL